MILFRCLISRCTSVSLLSIVKLEASTSLTQPETVPCDLLNIAPISSSVILPCLLSSQSTYIKYAIRFILSFAIIYCFS